MEEKGAEEARMQKDEGRWMDRWRLNQSITEFSPSRRHRLRRDRDGWIEQRDRGRRVDIKERG